MQVTVFVSSSYESAFASIISSYLITELLIIFAKYLSPLLVNVVVFKT